MWKMLGPLQVSTPMQPFQYCWDSWSMWRDSISSHYYIAYYAYMTKLVQSLISLIIWLPTIKVKWMNTALNYGRSEFCSVLMWANGWSNKQIQSKDGMLKHPTCLPPSNTTWQLYEAFPQENSVILRWQRIVSRETKTHASFLRRCQKLCTPMLDWCIGKIIVSIKIPRNLPD